MKTTATGEPRIEPGTGSATLAAGGRTAPAPVSQDPGTGILAYSAAEDVITGHLARYPGLTASEIACATGAASARTVKRTLARLAKAGRATAEQGPRSEADSRPCLRWRIP